MGCIADQRQKDVSSGTSWWRGWGGRGKCLKVGTQWRGGGDMNASSPLPDERIGAWRGWMMSLRSQGWVTSLASRGFRTEMLQPSARDPYEKIVPSRVWGNESQSTTEGTKGVINLSISLEDSLPVCDNGDVFWSQTPLLRICAYYEEYCSKVY